VRVYDTSYSRPAASLLQPGDGVILYSSRTLAKVPSPEECDAYRARGVTVRFVFEDSRGRATGTYAQGYSDGVLSHDMARLRGLEPGGVHYVACDVGNPISLEYARGFQAGLSSLFVPGLYAGDRNLEVVRTHLAWSHLWQASALSWSDHWDSELHRGNYRYANLWQSLAASPVPGTDVNIVNPNNPDWSGADMPFTTDDAATLFNANVVNPDGGIGQPFDQRLCETEKAAKDALVIGKSNATAIAALQKTLDAILASTDPANHLTGTFTITGEGTVTGTAQ
jgi:hypothetical protein